MTGVDEGTGCVIRISTPAEPQEVLWEGRLEAPEPLVDDFLRKGGGEETDARDVKAARPAATIGRPNHWDLEALARESGTDLAPELRLLLAGSRFSLLQLSFSLRIRERAHVERAWLVAHMEPEDEAQSVVYSYFPDRLLEPESRKVEIAVAPNLQLGPFSGELGKVATTIEFERLEPVVYASGLGETTATWDFSRHPQHPLVGGRFCYLVAQRPRTSKAIRLQLDLSADVRVGARWNPLSYVVPEDAERRTVVIET